MTLVQRYIATTILQTTGLVLLILLGMNIFILFVSEMRDLGHGQYGLIKVFEYVLLCMPQHLYRVFPMAGLLGVLLGLGLLAEHSELIVMRAAGISIKQMTFLVTKVILILLIVVTALGEVIIPITGRLADDIKKTAISGGQGLSAQNGSWLRDGRNFIHIKTILSSEQLEGVTRYEFDEHHRLLKVSYAKQAVYRKPDWVVKEVKQTRITPEKTYSTYFPDEKWKLVLNPTVLQSAVADPDTMSLSQLHETIAYHQRNTSYVGHYDLIFWRRVFQPLAMGVMMLLAVPFVFGPLRTVTMGVRILTGIIAGFSFYVANGIFGPMSLVLQFPPILAAIVPTLLFAMVGIFLLRRVR